MREGIELGGGPMTCQRLHVAASLDAAEVRLNSTSLRNLANSTSWLENAVAKGRSIYGINTGFGPFVREETTTNSAQKSRALLEHLHVGIEPYLSDSWIRASMLARLNTLLLGYSGVRAQVVECYTQLLNSGFLPNVPAVGSLGASGDLVPLAAIARVLLGLGHVHKAGARSETEISAEKLIASWNQNTNLGTREALALVNGTSVSSGGAALAAVEAESLIEQVTVVSALAYALTEASPEHLSAELHQRRGHSGSQRAAQQMRATLASLPFKVQTPQWLQASYSLRAAPHVLGSALDAVDVARQSVENELNSVDDNPVVTETDVYHGAHFFAQEVAFAADQINSALTQVGLLLERQLSLLLDPNQNLVEKLLLSPNPGEDSGLAGLQLTATAVAAEMRSDCQAHATFSIPTNGSNQDIVPMAPLAVKKALAQLPRVAYLLSSVGMALVQLSYLRGNLETMKSAWPTWLASFKPLSADRSLHDELRQLQGSVLQEIRSNYAWEGTDNKK